MSIFSCAWRTRRCAFCAPSRQELRTEQAMLPRDAFFAATERVSPKDAIGRISAEFVTPYPQGFPR
jgi:lysine decarboxylase